MNRLELSPQLLKLQAPNGKGLLSRNHRGLLNVQQAPTHHLKFLTVAELAQTTNEEGQ